MPVSVESLAFAMAVVAAGYFIFGVSGFGAALLTVPFLSHLWPVQFVLPVVGVLDVCAALFLGVRFSRQADRGELRRMIPLALVGAGLGVLLLTRLPREGTVAALGAFILAYGAYSLAERGTPRPIGARWAYVSGLAGGTTGALFGIGSPPYAIYLSRRIGDKGRLRASMATMVIFSVGSRMVLFALAGLLTWDTLKVSALLLPCAFLGLALGGRAHMRISREQLGRFISVLLAATGLSLLLRALL